MEVLRPEPPRRGGAVVAWAHQRWERLASRRARVGAAVAGGAGLLLGVALVWLLLIEPVALGSSGAGAGAGAGVVPVPAGRAGSSSGPRAGQGSARGVTTDLPRSEPSVASTTAGELVVQVVGAVTHPGVYRLAPGARVVDLVAAAGGLTPAADGAAVPLAAHLADGARVVVPEIGAGPQPGSFGVGTGPGATAPPAPVDLNAASADDLTTLPGIGPAIAAAIVAHRAQAGPFRSVDDLLTVPGIGPAKLAALRDRVRVGGG